MELTQTGRDLMPSIEMLLDLSKTDGVVLSRYRKNERGTHRCNTGITVEQ